MEPSSERGWGRPAWSFLHGMTLDPNAGPAQRESQKKLLQLLKSILPCPTCRESYVQYCSSLPQCSVEKVGDWVCELHDKVNLKLEKEASSFPADYWKFQKGLEPRNFAEDMFYFLFAMVSNYPRRFAWETRISKVYKEFFETLPQALNHHPVGKCIESYLMVTPLTNTILAKRENFTSWLYAMYSRCGKVMDSTQPLATIQETMEFIRK